MQAVETYSAKHPKLLEINGNDADGYGEGGDDHQQLRPKDAYM